MSSDASLPAVFIGHGSPMNTLEENRYTQAWSAFGRSIPRPRAILAISAHWFINATAVTAMAAPRTIHDFYGFPDELFAFEYPAPGSPAIASEVVDQVAPTWVGLDHDQWGLDHGTWSILAHMFPEADVPVLQLSIDAGKPSRYHVELGRALEPLRHKGILIFGSGNVVHNLRRIQFSKPDAGEDWAVRFDHAATELMLHRPGAIDELDRHPDYRAASPTPDHLLPLYYIAGVADAAGTTVEPFTEGCAYGSLSMTSYAVR